MNEMNEWLIGNQTPLLLGFIQIKQNQQSLYYFNNNVFLQMTWH